MTESEAIRVLKDFDAQVTAKADGAYQTNIGKMACDAAIKALEEVQQYRAVGTVEECRNAVEKIKQKRVTEKYKSGSPEDIEAYGEDAIFATCPTCGQLQNILWNSSNCGECGQALDWRANDGKTD